MLSGLIGALLVFCLGLARELWRNDRERRGVLRLLLAEIEHNVEVVRTVRESKPALIGSPDLPFMKTDAWQATRLRAAQLLPDQLFSDLEVYYSLLETLLTLLGFHNLGGEFGERWIRGAFARKLGREVPGSRDPFTWYTMETVEAQEKIPGRISAYLQRSWTENALQELRRWRQQQSGGHEDGA